MGRLYVRHRIDGLEKQLHRQLYLLQVRHRIDGLETTITRMPLH